MKSLYRRSRMRRCQLSGRFDKGATQRPVRKGAISFVDIFSLDLGCQYENSNTQGIKKFVRCPKHF